MSAIREEIRAILREELAALAEPMPQITTETVQISCSADLMRFAQDILTRAACPIFVANIATGRIRFTLPEIQPAMLRSMAGCISGSVNRIRPVAMLATKMGQAARVKISCANRIRSAEHDICTVSVVI